MKRRIWFHRSRAIGWLLLGAATFIFGFQDSVVMVWIASIYANVVSDWTASEAVDDRDVITRLDRIERMLTVDKPKG
jgi:hypothetical protein